MTEAVPSAATPAAESAAAFSLANHFLIAMPNMVDPSFSGAVVFVCEHSARGALGLVINRPKDLTLKGLFERVDLVLENGELGEAPVWFGGPVQPERGFVLHQQSEDQYTSSIAVSADLALTTSRDVLEAVAAGGGPSRLFVTLGFSGWGEGQLEQEIALNAWLTVEADPALLFDTPFEKRYGAAMRLLGVDPAMLSQVAGHA